jgi:uncharacterized protein (TIGR03435 family)
VRTVARVSIGWALLVGAAWFSHPFAQRSSAQTQSRLRFEVVSVKEILSPPTTPVGPTPPDRYRNRYANFSGLLTSSYELTLQQILNLPDWATELRFDIEAKAERASTAEQMREMVRSLLEDRFNLKAHRETRDLPIYTLSAARPDGRLGDKLRSSSVNCAAVVAARGADYRAPSGPRRPGEPPRCLVVSRVGPTSRSISMEGARLAQLVQMLQTEVGRVVVDKTALTGTFDFELTIPRTGPTTDASPSLGTDAAASIFTLLRDDMGLKLEPGRAPVEVLVVDHVERPTRD